MTREEMETTLNLSAPTVRKTINELKELNLVDEERQGLNKPNLIYLLECQNITIHKKSKVESGLKEKYNQANKDFSPIDTNHINHTNPNKTNLIYQTLNDSIDVNSIKITVKDKIQLDRLQRKYPNKHKDLQELYDIIVEVLSSRKQSFRISKEDMAASTVKSAFASLDSAHIEYVIESLAKNTTLVTSTKSYIQTSLFNAAKTIHNHVSLAAQNFLFDTFGIEPTPLATATC